MEENQYPVALPGAGHETLMWAWEHEIEPQAVQQIRRVADLPWVHGLRIMPDVHLGSGATIGTVIASKTAIVPSAVGVDIGCVDKDTEYLSPFGWKKISEYQSGSGAQVMQYDPDTGLAEFVTPDAFIKQEQKEFLHFKTKYGIDQKLSRNHKTLTYRITGRARYRIQAVMSAQELADIHESHVQGAKYDFETSFTPLFSEDHEIPLTDAQIRVQVAVNADGTEPDRHGTGREQGVVALKKQRKIDRMRSLLKTANIPFTEHSQKTDVVVFRFDFPWNKGYHIKWWRASLSQLKIISDEILHWDGNEDGQVFFTSDKASADFIQYVFSATGYRSVLREDPSRSYTGLPEYRVFRHQQTKVGLAGVPKSEIQVVESEDGFEYCFTVPSGFWVMRRNGNVAITGNCGVNAVKTNFKLDRVHDDLHKIRNSIEGAIPVGFDMHKHSLSDKDMPGYGWNRFWNSFKDLNVNVARAEDRMHKQMGTLGGGNHFIELCTDEDNNVWITLHSGSRYVGKEIAERHIDIAKKHPVNESLPDKELAVLLVGTPEAEAYRQDVEWAQEYAMRSRSVMMSLVKRALSARYTDIKFEDEINCHHNYVDVETIEGEEMVVTRKGAISAHKGELALIPGSMATGSYIVRGLGNPASYYSASHGAGRKMSRGEAKRTFTVADVERTMEGIEARKDEGVIDEISLAYKDIEQVIAAQSNLVETVARLQTVLCVKG